MKAFNEIFKNVIEPILNLLKEFLSAAILMDYGKKRQTIKQQEIQLEEVAETNKLESIISNVPDTVLDDGLRSKAYKPERWDN